MARLEANLAAITVVKALQAETRAATTTEQQILAGWSGWGAVAAVFAKNKKPREERAFAPAHQKLKTLLTDEEYAAARRNTLNAHYTGTALAQAMWDGLAAFGFGGGRVLEPGCGSGNFIGLAPLGTAMVGVELDPVTAHVAAALYPHAQIRNESFADTQLREGSFDAAIGNVPFGKIHLNDARYNPSRRYPIHTHFLLKSAAMVRPGGLIALITSRYTLDGVSEDAVAARRQLAGLGDLAAAVRLPSSAHRRAAGTDVVTDVLLIRRFDDGEQPPADEPAWMQTVPVDIDGVQIPVNRYFADHPDMVLGELATGGAKRADDLRVIASAGADVADGLTKALTTAAAARAATAPRPAVPAAVMEHPPEGYQQARPEGIFTRIIDGFAEPFDPPGGRAGPAELRALLGLRDAAMALLDAELATSEDAGLVDDLRARLNARYDSYVAAYGPVNRQTRQVRLRSTPAGRALRDQLLADGEARYTGGVLEISDPAVRDRLVAAGHATVTETGELRFGRTRAARTERQRLIDSGQAHTQGGSLTITDAGRAYILDNAADLEDAVTIIRVRPPQGGFRNDPFAVRVMALEKYDPETGTGRKNDIMRHRVLLPRPVIEQADGPEDALAICMDRHAQVRLDVIAALLGVGSEQEARDRLGMLVFDDPAAGRLVPAPEYLSGDVREKLRQAEAAAADDPSYQVNVTALTEVIPPDLGPAEIEARLGAVFITLAEVQQFLRETLADESVTVRVGKDATWSVNGGDRHGVAATITWGTAARDALSLAEHLLNRGGPIKITRTAADGTTWTDEEASAAAREKQAELSDRFAGWAWEDLDRARELCRRYNDTFNAIVLRSYDEVKLSLPGVNRDISLFWWQKAAIARMIYEPTAGLFHDMGAGKTLEQIIGVMEQKRLGLIRKPVICVKNHLLDQFRDEFLWGYPQARILCADTSDLAGEGRRQFIARCGAENPDAIIMTRGAFESIPLTPEGHEAYLDYMKQMFSVHAEAVTGSVKDEETLLAEFEERLRAYFDPEYGKDEDEDEPDHKRGKRKVEQDPAMCWEQMGIDYVCVDESQDYNNLWVPSDEPGMAIGFTHRAIDLEMKLHAIRNRYGSRACTLATGTPVTNKIPQFYVLQRYLRPERLQMAGFAGYAPWAATYTEAEQRLEMKANGQFGMVDRMRLINFPELLLELHYFGDFKGADDIGLPRPAIRGGKPEIRGNPAVTELREYQATLPQRYNDAKGGKKEKGDDTVVAVIGDGFRAAQDLRLVKAHHGARPKLTDEPQKIDHIADDIYAEWIAHRDDIYPGEDGQPDPVRGSLQFVFCNEGVPSADWNLYDELRSLLIDRGMPRQLIRFIHDAGDARKKAALFAACNAGHVAVLMGSTEKMGVGTNAQRRAIGVHHVHPHWRPDYDAQEDARARRPGNLNGEVFIKRWITEGSFDTIRAQACERKSVFLRVVKHRDTSVRSIEAPDDDTVSYAAIAAVGAGEPRLIQKAQLESELAQLARAQRRHANNQNALKVAEQQARAATTAAEQTIRDIDAAAVRVIPTFGDAFRMTVDGTVFASRREAGDHLIACLREARARVPAGTCQTRTAGMIGGFQLAADLANEGREDSIVLRLAGLPGGIVRLDHRKLPGGIGLVTRLENRLSGLDKLRLEQQATLGRQRQEITRAQSAIGAPFPQQDALLTTKKALDALVTELRGDKDDSKADPAATAAGSADPRQDHADGPARSDPGRTCQPANLGGDGLSQRAPTAASPQPARPDPAQPPAPAAPPAQLPVTTGTSNHAEQTQPPRVAPALPALADGAAPNSPAPTAPPGPSANQDQAAAPEPADNLTDGLVIEHHQQGTLVHGTEKNDQQVRRLLRDQGFRWSGNLNAWYLPRPWNFSTRNHRVTGLTGGLRQAHRSFAMRRQDSDEPGHKAATTSAPRLAPPADAGQPDDGRQAAVGKALQAKTALKNGGTAVAGAAPDAAAPATGQEPGTTGPPDEVHAGREQQPGAGAGVQDDPAQQAGTTPGQKEKPTPPETHATSTTLAQPAPAAHGAASSQHTDTSQTTAEAATTAPRPAQGEPGAPDNPEPQASPVNNSDLAIALRHLPGFARLVSRVGTPPHRGSRNWRPDGEPDVGAHQAVDCDATGIEITISGAGFQRHGHLTWPQVASWIDAGMTPARLGLIITADRLSMFCRTRREEMIAAGECDPDAAGTELGQIRDDTIRMAIGAALSTRGAAAPVPPARPGQPAYYTAAMIARPDPAASKAENAALERLTQLRAAVREPQPVTADEVRSTIRRWIGDGLPDYARALGKPAAMRAWISRQVTTWASRPVHVTYDSPGIPGGRWYGASPEGLLTARGSDDRAETLIPWEEIPAWIQPGITSSLRDQMLTADNGHRAIIRRQLTAAVHPHAGPGHPAGQDDEQAARLRREAIAATWAAIEAAPPPTPAQLEHARRLYRDTGPVQESLFGAPGPADSRQQEGMKPAGDSAPAAQPPPLPAKAGSAERPGSAATPRASGMRAAPARQREAPAAGNAPDPAPPANRRPAAGTTRPGAESSPLASDDIFHGLRRLPVIGFAELICAMDAGESLDNLVRYLEPCSGDRAVGQPDAGARETLTCTPRGIRVQVAASSGTRAGQLGWPEVADWLRPGLTHGRLRVMRQAAQTRLRFTTVSASFRATGEADLAASAELELRNLIGATVSAALETARSAATGSAVPEAQQPPAGDEEALALERIGHLASALPPWPPQWRKPVSQVQAGDIVGHPAYKLQPFRVSARPRRNGDRIEIAGRLTEPDEGEPAGEITWTVAITGQEDPAVHLIPVPARSLRPGSPKAAEPATSEESLTPDSSDTRADAPQRQPAAAASNPGLQGDAQHIDGGPAGGTTAGNAPPAGPAAASGGDMSTSQPQSTPTATEEDNTMSPAPAERPVPPAENRIHADPGPAQADPAAARAAAGARTDTTAGRTSEEATLLQELDDVLTAILQHRHTTAPDAAGQGDDFTDIRAAFASLRHALEPPAASHRPPPDNPVPGPAPAEQPSAAAAAAADDFADIRTAFADLRRALDLPAQARHTRTPGPHPDAPEADAASGRLLDQAAAEAQACARWYRDMPEWQRITTVSRAARNLLTAIQEACGDYWDEIRQDIRVRGFTRTLAARVCLAVSGTAHILAARIERAGHKDTRIWRAAWGLHRATATFADRIMRYTPPEHPARMNEARHIIGDLAQRPGNPRRPETPYAATPGSRTGRPPSPVALANTSFPVRVSTAGAAAGPPTRTPTGPGQPRVAHRP